MKLTKRTLRKLIKEEFKTSRLKEDNGGGLGKDYESTGVPPETDLEDEDALDLGSLGELSPEDRKILQELIERFTAIAKAKNRSGKDVELKDYRTQISAKLLELERLITGERGERLSPGRISQQADVVQTRRRAKELAREGG